MAATVSSRCCRKADCRRRNRDISRLNAIDGAGRYEAFKRLKNFATLVPQKNRLLLYLHLDPDRVLPLPANGRDVRQSGHWGTGDLELSLTNLDALDAAKALILMAYEGRGSVTVDTLMPNRDT